jgi:dihydropteroate synthase
VGTVAANAWATLAGASILRVHNVGYTRDLVDVLEALRQEALGLEEARLQASSGD